ncbi:polysaccharide biosynthesis protein [Roseibium sp. TrichSKD4]|uniref:alpha/beta hydrolase n=1 Tax=Roseibium sp. TrichSKD4 TaxID=744980 RepID=UPI0001E563A5|nr:alpha/beta hydrolase [Roseibium sp. TrichSKD4]EFO33031.1 polysaccharide biosynthesis protein [Roseibium sp. TrichSKD4]
MIDHLRPVPVSLIDSHGIFAAPNLETRRSAAVLMLRPWGFDELCTRKFFRRLAEELSQAGIASLRFDYPGTVDALDPRDGQSLQAWESSALSALDTLHKVSGADEIIIFGFGLGSVIAQQIYSHSLVKGVVHAAPVGNPRRYLREVELRAKVIHDGLGLDAFQILLGHVSIAGIIMEPRLAEDLRTFSPPRLANIPTLVVSREDKASDQKFVAQMKEAGCPVSEIAFDGYTQLLEDPTASIIPDQVLSQIVDWCIEHSSAATSIFPLQTTWSTHVSGSGYIEEGVIIEGSAPLYGVLCSPEASEPDAPALIFLNSGYDHHGGWARAWVEASRRCASKGALCLRADFANIGDSPPANSEPEQVLYTEGPIKDTSALIDFIRTKTSGPITLVGRCSGAYTAFQAAFRDDRITQLFLCNQVRLIWDPEESLTDPTRMGPRSMGDYKKRFGDPKTLKRLLTGDISIPGVMRGLSSHAVTRVSHMIAPVWPNISKHGRFRQECHEIFKALRARDVSMYFLCSEGDQSLEQLALYFGKDRKGLRAYPNVTLTKVPNADHNLTPPAARESFFGYLENLIER